MKYDKPSYQITAEVLNLLASVSERIGEVNAIQLNRPAAELRKSNRIKTIQSSLAIEGNTITEEQITALLNNKHILAPKKDILEVQNAIAVYDQLEELKPYKLTSLLKAHKQLMTGLVNSAGQLRSGNVGIVKGSKITHVAPPGNMVKHLLSNLILYAQHDPDPVMIKSCVFHYEFEFIHPFADGNGRMGRLWQTILLMNSYPVFQFLPIESIIKADQDQYYHALNHSDSIGHCSPFLVFMLKSMIKAFDVLLDARVKPLTTESRVEIYKAVAANKEFTRKEYLSHFKVISQATASRDLKDATERSILVKKGDKRLATYKFRI
ncbi:Fic family protein [Pedobacter sp. UYP24]